ncbi:MAG: hypothetical protein R2825_11585 [Saprospiraceae bacterium]
MRAKPEFAIGGTYSGLYLFKLNEKLKLAAVQKIDGFNESSRFFEEDQKGNIWVGQFYKGLYQLELSEALTEASVKKVTAEDGAPIDEQIILSKIDNELYLATRKGLYQIDQTTDRIVKPSQFSKTLESSSSICWCKTTKKYPCDCREHGGLFQASRSNNYIFVPLLVSIAPILINDLLNVSVNTDDVGAFQCQ